MTNEITFHEYQSEDAEQVKFTRRRKKIKVRDDKVPVDRKETHMKSDFSTN